MKKKVLDALDNIYREGINNKLVIEISKENNFDINKLVTRARIISKKILHNYKDFNLMTIDKFNCRKHSGLCLLLLLALLLRVIALDCPSFPTSRRDSEGCRRHHCLCTLSKGMQCRPETIWFL